MTAMEVDRRDRFTTLKRIVADRQAQVIDFAKQVVEAGGLDQGRYIEAMGEALIGLRQAEDALAAFCDAEQTAIKGDL